MHHEDRAQVGRDADAADSRRPVVVLGDRDPATDAARVLGRRAGLTTETVSSASDIRALQRSVGNRATRQLLRLKKDAEFDDAVALARESFTALQQFATGLLTMMLGGLGTAIASFLFRPHLVFIMGSDSGGFYDIAEHYWRLHSQPVGAWEQGIVHTGREARVQAAETSAVARAARIPVTSTWTP